MLMSSTEIITLHVVLKSRDCISAASVVSAKNSISNHTNSYGHFSNITILLWLRCDFKNISQPIFENKNNRAILFRDKKDDRNVIAQNENQTDVYNLRIFVIFDSVLLLY